ncbi:hypothetical protein JCM19240_4130 [Vibrio maritimus]|uniref:Uncharacterized protein n=1 Tax=Vibrio maritimus TaxID=990268 RepID=A0A090T3P7_9VIBR|nr:hypothetical protein JCM19240_4130 [Vibrio maritimus]
MSAGFFVLKVVLGSWFLVLGSWFLVFSVRAKKNKTRITYLSEILLTNAVLV